MEGASAKATVLSYTSSSPNSVVITDLFGGWKSSELSSQVYVTKTNNTAYRVVTGLDDKFGTNIDDSNAQIQEEAEQYLNFTEKHPFGEP